MSTQHASIFLAALAAACGPAQSSPVEPDAGPRADLGAAADLLSPPPPQPDLGRTDGATKVLLHRAIRPLEGIVAQNGGRDRVSNGDAASTASRNGEGPE